MTIFDKFKQANKVEMAQMLTALVLSATGETEPTFIRSTYLLVLESLDKEVK